MKALINPLQNNIVVQVEQDNSIFEVAEPLHWLSCPNNITAYNYEYNEGQFVSYTPPPPTADKNKQTAISLLQQTDWTTIADVGNPATANPYLANQTAFISWRSQVRAIAVNPVDGNLEVLSLMPIEDWQTV
jgi:hypothetical protein